jgi:hypothetical protein
MAPPDNLNNQSKGKSAKSTSKINNKTDFQLKKQRLSDLRKEKLSKPKPATAKVTTFLPESQRVKIPFIIKQVAPDGNCLFRSKFLLHRVLMTPAIWNYDRDALTLSLLNGTIMLRMQTLVINQILLLNQKYHCPTKVNQAWTYSSKMQTTTHHT